MSYPKRLLNVPYHRQDCPGYCALGCVTMILDANRMIPPGGYSQVADYTSVYRNPGPPGSSSPAGDYDRWHVSPWQLQTLLKSLKYEVDHDSPAGIDRLLQKVRAGLDRQDPAVVLLSYDGLASAGKHHASGTHWVVVYGYTTDATGVTGYYTRDPWRGWAPGPKEKPAFLHKAADWGGKPCCEGHRPEMIDSWQRSPFEGPNSVVTAGTPRASGLGQELFGGIRTDGRAYVLTVNPHAPPLSNSPKEGIPKGTQTKITVSDWPKLLQPLFINGIEAGDTASVPPEFAQAMEQPNNAIEEKVERTDGAAGGWYHLTAWPSASNNNRVVAWSSQSSNLTEPAVDGAAVLNAQWPRIQTRPDGVLRHKPVNQRKFVLHAPKPDPDWFELNGFFDRLRAFVDDFNADKIKDLKVDRLVWEPCIASLSPAMPFYEVKITLPAVGTLPALTFRALIDLEGGIHRRLRRSSKAGA